MNARGTPGGLRTARLAATLATVIAGCASAPVLFPGATNVAELAPDERVVIGQLRFANGGLSKLLPEPYVASWPRFTYDYQQLQPPRDARRGLKPPFGPEGGVFAFRAKRQRPVYFEAMIVETLKLVGDHVLWTMPVALKLPPSTARCAYVGTITIEVSGVPLKKPSFAETFRGVELPPSQVHTTVVDDYEHDRAVLAGYVQGCDLQRTLAERPSDEELRPLLEIAAARRKAAESNGHWNAENDRLRRH